MLRRLHPIAGVIGFATILTFWLSTVTSELFGSTAVVAAVKETIPWGFLIVVPALAIAGASGFRIAGASSDPRIDEEKAPHAVHRGERSFHSHAGRALSGGAGVARRVRDDLLCVQAIELVAGAINLTLMSLNIRDGLELDGEQATAVAGDRTICTNRRI